MKIISLFTGVALLSASLFPVQASDSAGFTGDHRSPSFIAPFIYTLMVSNKLYGVSNLNSAVNISGLTGFAPTNAVGVVFTNFNTGPLAALTTNNIGTGVFVTNGVYDTVNLLQDVVISPPTETYGNLYFAGTNVLQNYIPSGVSVLIELFGTNAAANSAVNFVFSPLYDGTNDVTTTSGDQWTVGVTANGTTRVCIATNAPLYQWPGAKALRLRSITDTDTDAASNVFIRQVRLCRWQQ